MSSVKKCDNEHSITTTTWIWIVIRVIHVTGLPHTLVPISTSSSTTSTTSKWTSLIGRLDIPEVEPKECLESSTLQMSWSLVEVISRMRVDLSPGIRSVLETKAGVNWVDRLKEDDCESISEDRLGPSTKMYRLLTGQAKSIDKRLFA